ncbi:MAG: hypothetical protein R3348_04180 [Xanthomonadales bacterium]|nr:hypothetical protein [Xanthomonadales bacterium]
MQQPPVENLSAEAQRRWNRGQVVKWTVYGLLLLNFFYYFFQEWYIASHTLARGGTLLQWMEEFSTTIDELGWFGLLFAFELETYQLSDQTLKRRKVRWSVHGIRLLCYLMLAHTVFARVSTVQDFEAVQAAENVQNLCQLVGQEVYFGENYEYQLVTTENCEALAEGNEFWFTEPGVITDADGYALQKKLVWVDLNDAIMWILVVWAIELAVWLQNRGITGGRLMLVSHGAKVIYAVLWAHAAWWAYIGQWVWAWDEALWIAGFWAIEKNMSEWRDEIRQGAQTDTRPASAAD